MIIVTGAAGFIGSALISKLNDLGLNELLVSDDFSDDRKNLNLEGKDFIELVHRDDLFKLMDSGEKKIDFVLHIGARTDTAEFNMDVLNVLNLNYTKDLWNRCVKLDIPIIYASSAATYGLGEFGYDDKHEVVDKLQPLNAYGVSKNEFDKWALKQDKAPPFWAGLKFFNVYGPNEYHKDRMASVIIHAFKQITETAKMNLFRSHNPDYKDGEQLRDFVYVKDVIDVIIFLMDAKPKSGLYNLGTGEARSFLDLVKATFNAMNLEADIDFIDTPIDIRDKYQYFTEANMSKLKSVGYDKDFTSLEDGVTDYVTNYLSERKYL